jgi:hypothetical protein
VRGEFDCLGLTKGALTGLRYNLSLNNPAQGLWYAPDLGQLLSTNTFGLAFIQYSLTASIFIVNAVEYIFHHVSVVSENKLSMRQIQFRDSWVF